MSSNYLTQIKEIWETAAHPFNDLWEWAKKPRQRKDRAKRWDALADWAASHAKEANHDHDEDAQKHWRAKARIYRKKAKQNRDEPHDEVPGIENGWHPDAVRAGVVSGIGPLQGSRRIVWHTTEGYGLPNYQGSNPHFTVDPVRKVLYQHQSVYQGARALQNLSGGVETNRQGAIQVEIIGFASQSQNWSEGTYDFLADLARWIEAHCDVDRTCGVSFIAGVKHMSGAVWNDYRGHCGHQHVPENNHWDPGRLDIAKILDK